MNPPRRTPRRGAGDGYAPGSPEVDKPAETPLQRAVTAVLLVCLLVLAVAATIAGVRALL